jgi:hypothetical protein
LREIPLKVFIIHIFIYLFLSSKERKKERMKERKKRNEREKDGRAGRAKVKQRCQAAGRAAWCMP